MFEYLIKATVCQNQSTLNGYMEAVPFIWVSSWDYGQDDPLQRRFAKISNDAVLMVWSSFLSKIKNGVSKVEGFQKNGHRAVHTNVILFYWGDLRKLLVKSTNMGKLTRYCGACDLEDTSL